MIAPEMIKRGFVETVRFSKTGERITTVEKVPGLDVILSENGDVIGWSCRNGSASYLNLKREIIRERNVPQLQMIAGNPRRDIDFVFDASSYIKLRKTDSPKLAPVVMIMLYKSQVDLIKNELGYPVIVNSEFLIP